MLPVNESKRSDVQDFRFDRFVGTSVHIVGRRQDRPMMHGQEASATCPFCPGGLEAPDPYEVRWFVNRWPSMPGDRCEVLLYTPNHSASLASMMLGDLRRIVDLWTDRMRDLARRPDVDYVLIFENRGSEVGATIAHPHGQIYAYDHVPSRPMAMFTNKWTPEATPERTILHQGEWFSFVPSAPVFPVAVTIAPTSRVALLTDLDDSARTNLAAILLDTFQRLDRLFDSPLPYMMWINQRPTNDTFDDAWMSIEIVSPWRAPGLARYIAAAEIGGGEFFLPVVPEEVALQLRRLNP